MKIIDGVVVFGDPIDEQAVEQIKNCGVNASGTVLCGDHHLGYSQPIGGVVAYDNFISPSGVGFDIGCGNKAVRLTTPSGHVKTHISKIMDEIQKTISFGVGRNNEEDVDHDLFYDELWDEKLGKALKDKARKQLGTVGSGNHYVDVFVDEQDRIWVGVHFGSRGFGHGVATHFLKKAGAKDGMMEPPCLLHMDTDIGCDYYQWMELAGRYAYAGRDWVCAKVAEIIGGNIVEEIHNHHNYAWKEEHNGKELIVVRKGATPAFPGQKGFVGGSMGDISVILEGVDSETSKQALYSTVHGAGRVMGRMEAKGKKKKMKDPDTHEVMRDADGEILWRTVKEGKVNRKDMDAWLEREGVVLRGADVDESPFVYKRLPEVLNHHDGTIKVLHTLKPLGVCMAGSDTFDPYKD